MNQHRVKVWRREFKDIFGKLPTSIEWRMWKKMREKSGFPTLTESQKDDYRLLLKAIEIKQKRKDGQLPSAIVPTFRDPAELL